MVCSRVIASTKECDRNLRSVDRQYWPGVQSVPRSGRRTGTTGVTGVAAKTWFLFSCFPVNTGHKCAGRVTSLAKSAALVGCRNGRAINIIGLLAVVTAALRTERPPSRLLEVVPWGRSTYPRPTTTAVRLGEAGGRAHVMAAARAKICPTRGQRGVASWQRAAHSGTCSAGKQRGLQPLLPAPRQAIRIGSASAAPCHQHRQLRRERARLG